MQRTDWKLAALNILVVVTLACGDETTDATVQESCQAACEWRVRCQKGATDLALCVTQCVTSHGNASVYRPDVLGATKSCYDGLTCAQRDDECDNAMIQAGQADADASALLESCKTRYRGCNMFDDPFDCFYVLRITSTARDKVRTCLKKDCQEIVSCVDTSLGISSNK